MPSLEFTLMVGCPLKCTFCPQDALRGAYGKAEKYMSFDTFSAILAKVPKHVRIDFSGMAEPWTNADATAMLSEVLAAGYNVAIYTTLYGMEEDVGDVVRLLLQHAQQIEVLCLHLPDANSNMRGWKWSGGYEIALKMMMGLQHILPRFEVMTMDRTGRVHPDLAHLGIRLGAWLGHTRAGNVAPPDGQQIEPAPHHETAVMCSFTPLYDQNVVLPNGDVALCCMDYSAKHRLGNLLEQDYYDIFAGQELGRLRAENMRLEFSDRSLCRTCNRAQPLRTGPAARQFWRAA